MSNRPKGDFMPHQIPGLRPRKLPPYAKRKPEVSDGCMVLFILLLSMMFALTATKCAAQPDTEFRSLFQIRYAMPDSVQLIHFGYNLRVNSAGVECIPINPAYGTEPPISVQSWIQGDGGEWIGVTKSGGTVTLYGAGPGMYLEVISKTEILQLFNMAPAVLTLKDSRLAN